ncbi:MuF-like minor capsid protein [Mycobacterium phage ZoeJ]|uniref:MuF-like minor capsid protein n=1 Tax=Mycobacterium phage ZoeJ TaxID=1486427 RepID=A0A023W5B6_9CAUD|nr:head maturation protease [Mycobacterium phage ZoeJ]AHY26830.1 MuF-like minor capsid protein [Mycobacterium phage ZoeJ]
MVTAAPEFQGVLAELSGRAGIAVERLVPKLSGLTEAEGLRFITDAYPALIDPYLSASAKLTTQWYDEQPTEQTAGKSRNAQVGRDLRGAPAKGKLFVPEPAALPDPDRLGANARWALLQNDPVVALQGSATRAVMDSSRRTVLDNAKREGVRWARYASITACGFCRMLATRGSVYKSADTALRSHDHCVCLAVPDRNGTYQPPDYVQQWEQDYLQARRDGLTTPQEISRAMEAAGEQRTATRRWLDAEKVYQRNVSDWLDAEFTHKLSQEYWQNVDAELNKAIGEPAPAKAEPAPAEAPLDRMLREANAAMEAGDYDKADKLLGEADKLERAQKAKAAKAERDKARRQAADAAKQDEVLNLVEQGWEPAEAEAHVYGKSVESIRRRDFMAQARGDGHSGKSFDELVGDVHAELAAEQFWKAEAATNGYMLKRKYEGKVDPRTLWTMNETTARKYMSEEMAAWFDQHGRLTRAGLRESVLSGNANWRNPLTADFLQ